MTIGPHACKWVYFFAHINTHKVIPQPYKENFLTDRGTVGHHQPCVDASGRKQLLHERLRKLSLFRQLTFLTVQFIRIKHFDASHANMTTICADLHLMPMYWMPNKHVAGHNTVPEGCSGWTELDTDTEIPQILSHSSGVCESLWLPSSVSECSYWRRKGEAIYRCLKPFHSASF